MDTALTSHESPAISPNDIFIAVMGMTGAGKSTFIEHCTKTQKQLSGDNLFSCTSRVSIHTTQVQGRTVHLLDTPGFNDSRRSDGEVLQELAYWLAVAYERDIKLSGLIYLHCITNNRLQGTAARTLDIFKKMCGKEAFCGVVIATTMWNKVAVNELAKTEKRHDEFHTRVQNDIIRYGGKLVSLSAIEIDAVKIVHHIVGKDQGITLAFQRQLIDERRLIYETDAGKVVFQHLSGRYRSLQTTVDELHGRMDEIVSTGWKEMLCELSDTASEMAKGVRSVEEEMECMKIAFDAIQEKWEAINYQDDEYLILTEQDLKQQFELERSCSGNNNSDVVVHAEGSAPFINEVSTIPKVSTNSSFVPRGLKKLRLRELDRERRKLSIQMGQRLSQRYMNRRQESTAIGTIGVALAAGQLVAALACVVM